MKKQKPWTDENGKPLSDEALREVACGWDAEMWNAYLESLESRSHEENEHNFGDLSIIDDLGSKSLVSLQPDTDHLSDELLDDVKVAIEELPTRERFAMEEELYLGKSQRNTASELNVSRATVQKIRKKSFKKLAVKLSKHRSS